MRPWRVAVATIGAAGALVAGGAPPARAIAASSAPSAAAGAGAGLVTPVLSARRLPDWVAETVATQRLRTSLASALDGSGKAAQSVTSCLLVTQGEATLYSSNAAMEMIPASNLKLLTATAVLQRLGSDHRFVTRVTADVPPEAGVVGGNLYLVGAGDPGLQTPAYAAGLSVPEPAYTSLARLARQVRDAGVTTVTGSVVGDPSRYDDELGVPSWDPVYASEGDVGQLSALDVDEGYALPASPTGPGTLAAAVAAIAANAAAAPAVRSAAIFTQLLASDGVRVQGRPESGRSPDRAALVTSIVSAPLSEQLDSMLTVSDDTAAELFTKEIGVDVEGSGTTDAGTRAIRATLTADHLPVSGLVQADGSGLDRLDRVTCALIHADLEYVGTRGVIAAGLPVAGRTGTLAGRMLHTPAAGRLRAKTGTLNGVASLSGFVAPGAKPPIPAMDVPIVFSLILNGVPSTAQGAATADRVGVALAEFPQLPPMASIEPLR